jgi:Ca2+-binding EF-hand superfamily protein
MIIIFVAEEKLRWAFKLYDKVSNVCLAWYNLYNTLELMPVKVIVNFCEMKLQ